MQYKVDGTVMQYKVDGTVGPDIGYKFHRTYVCMHENFDLLGDKA